METRSITALVPPKKDPRLDGNYSDVMNFAFSEKATYAKDTANSDVIYVRLLTTQGSELLLADTQREPVDYVDMEIDSTSDEEDFAEYIYTYNTALRKNIDVVRIGGDEPPVCPSLESAANVIRQTIEEQLMGRMRIKREWSVDNGNLDR